MIDRLTGFLVVVIIALGSYTVYQYLEARQIETKNAALLGTVTEAKRLEGDLLQLRSEYKTEKTLNKELKNKFNELKVNLAEKTKLVADLSVRLGGHSSNSNTVNINGTDSPEICFKTDDGIGVYPFTVDTSVGLLRDTRTGHYRMITSSYYVLDKDVDSKWAGLPYQLSETTGTLQIDPTQQSTKLTKGLIPIPFNINLGLNSDSKATLTLTLLGYGKSKQNLDFKALSIGVAMGNNRKAEPYIELLSMRPYAEVLTNTYIGVGYGKDEGFSFGINAGL